MAKRNRSARSGQFVTEKFANRNKSTTVTETAKPKPRPNIHFGFHIFMDGNAWCAVGPAFRNLQEDQAGFGRTRRAAYDDWVERNSKERFWRGRDFPPFRVFYIHPDK